MEMKPNASRHFGNHNPGWRAKLLIATEGCSACEDLAVEVEKAPAVSALSGMVRVQAEASEHPDLVGRYAAEATPTVLVFVPDIGYETPVYAHTGVLTAEELVRLAGMVRPGPAAESTIESANPNAVSPAGAALQIEQQQHRPSSQRKHRVLGRLFASVGRLTAHIIR